MRAQIAEIDGVEPRWRTKKEALQLAKEILSVKKELLDELDMCDNGPEGGQRQMCLDGSVEVSDVTEGNVCEVVKLFHLLPLPFAFDAPKSHQITFQARPIQSQTSDGVIQIRTDPDSANRLDNAGQVRQRKFLLSDMVQLRVLIGRRGRP